MKGLTGLHAFNAESNKRIVIGGVPQIVESNAQLHLLALVSESIVGVDDNEMIAGVYWA